MQISVCIATYNGDKYIRKQLDSILSQINENDEVIIVDDFSKDNTVLVVENVNDKRIKIFRNDTNMGHVYSFCKAVNLAKGDFIFMADQDDIWTPGRVFKMIEQMNKSNVFLVSGNSSFINESDEDITFQARWNSLQSITSNKYYKNIFSIFMGSIGYFGCTMLLKKDFKKIILPIPTYVESHDLWIAIAANICKSNEHLEEDILFRRIHNSNVSTKNRSFYKKVISRIIFFISFIHLLIRSKKK